MKNVWITRDANKYTVDAVLVEQDGEYSRMHNSFKTIDQAINCIKTMLKFADSQNGYVTFASAENEVPLDIDEIILTVREGNTILCPKSAGGQWNISFQED